MTTTANNVATGVQDVAAAHVAAHVQATGGTDELTIVWSTLPLRTESGRLGLTPEDTQAPRRIWDETGTGRWAVTPDFQDAGRPFYRTAVILDGHVDGDKLEAAARQIAADEDARLEAEVEAIRARLAVDLAGPREECLSEMVRAYARAIGHRGWMPVVSLPGALGRAQRSGALLPKPGAILGRQTFDEWLDALPNR